MKIKLLGFLTLIVLATSLFFYFKPKNDDLFIPEIVDYPHKIKRNALFEKADAYKYAQDYKKADAEFQRLLKQPLADSNRHYVLNQLAYINLTMNEDSTAYKWIQLLEKNKTPLSKNALADYHFNIGVWAYHGFKPKMAEGYLKRALITYEDIYQKKHLKLAICKTKLGMSYYEFGQIPDSAFVYLPLAYEIFQQNDILKKFSVECELGMSQISYLKFENEKSLSHIEEGISLIKPHQEQFYDLYLRCLSQKGDVFRKAAVLENDTNLKANLMKKAFTYLDEAYKLGKKRETNRQQEFIKNLIVYASQNKDKASVQKYFEELSNLLSYQSNKFAFIERLKGFYQYKLKNYDDANYWYHLFWNKHANDSLCSGLYFLETTNILEKIYTEKLDFDSAIYFRKQNILLLTGNRLGEDILLKDILLPKVYTKSKYVFGSYFEIAQTLLKKYEFSKDLNTLDSAFSISKLTDDNLFQNIFSSEDEAMISYQKEYGERAYLSAIRIANILYQKRKENKIYLDYGFRFCERLKSMLLFRNITINDSLKKPVKILDSIRLLNTLISQNRNQSTLASRDNNTSKYEYQLQKLYKKIEEEYPEYLKSKTNQVIDPVDVVKSKIGYNKAVVHYTLGKDKWYRIIINGSRVDFQEFDSCQQLINKIHQLKSYLNNDSIQPTVQQYHSLTSELCQILLGNRITNDFLPKELIIIPDKALNIIPFEVLTESMNALRDTTLSYNKLPYLLIKHQIKYSPSWKVFQRNLKSTFPTNPTIGAFTLSFESQELPYSVAQIKSISNYFDKNNTFEYIGNKCSKKNFIQSLDRYNILQISLHAESNASNKYDNQIYFAPNRKDTLFSFELIKEQINTNLVILSACKTGEGKIDAGEGVYSLARIFQQCGAANIISSLWEVDNYTTSEILSIFFKNLAGNSNPSKSLYLSKKQFLANCLANDAKANPKYWGGLIFLQ